MTDLPGFARALLDPKTYPELTAGVELVQTQMSFLFIGDEYVYKVKKPVNLGFLDYTSLEQRRAFCEKEVVLNRRLCPEAYLGVVPVCWCDGAFRLGSCGQVVEYAVKMRKLPRERMMDVLLPQDAVTAEMVSHLAARLVEFHARAATGPEIGRFGDIETVKQNTAENFSQTEKYIGRTLSRVKYDRIKAYTEEFNSSHAALFRERVAAGRVRDCHGDLHAAHVCFIDGICVYDCIEFNDRFRYCDVASEIAFLAMDLDHYGRADLSNDFVRAYVQASGDPDIGHLLKFYKCYRAYVRGKVEGFKLDDPYIAAEEKSVIRVRASSYFDLALAYTRPKPVLFITAGLMGTGKSTLAAGLAERIGLVVIASDVTRKRMADVPPDEARFESYDEGIYSPEFTRRTYDLMLEQARGRLDDGVSVVLDASFARASDRERAQALARETRADFFILECVLDEATVKQRLDERVKRGSVSDGRWEIFGEQKARFEAVTECPECHLVINTSGGAGAAVEGVLERTV